MSMLLMLSGLLIVLGVHSVRIFDEHLRNAAIARIGRPAWMVLFSVLSLAGFVLLVYGFSGVREQPVVIWQPPPTMRHLALAFTLIAFVLLVAEFVPANQIRARVRHPAVLGIESWAIAHLLANGMLAHWLLFGSILLWGLASYRAARLRDRREDSRPPAGRPLATVLTVLLGLVSWLIFATWLHGWLIGIRPLAW